MKKALTIAGSDSCGGAGIQADIKTFSANGVYAMSVITAVTAQNTKGVLYVQDLEPETIARQIEAIFDDIKVDAVKIGMVSQIESILTIAKSLNKYKDKLPHIVLDPVMVSKSGYNLLSKDAKDTLVSNLFPLATLITPNLPEAEEILGYEIKTIDKMKKACEDLNKMGVSAVLVKGGHLEDKAWDVLYDGSEFHIFKQEIINTPNTHGTGCTLSSAIAANLAKGKSLYEAVKASKEYVTMAIKHSFAIGKGVGPTHHFYELYKNSKM